MDIAEDVKGDERGKRWAQFYDLPDHLGWDLRMIADRLDAATGYATMDANILRRAATCFDGLPVNTSGDEALSLARQAASAIRSGER